MSKLLVPAGLALLLLAACSSAPQDEALASTEDSVIITKLPHYCPTIDPGCTTDIYNLNTADSFEAALAAVGCSTEAEILTTYFYIDGTYASSSSWQKRYWGKVTRCPQSADLTAIVASKPSATMGSMCDACVATPGVGMTYVTWDKRTDKPNCSSCKGPWPGGI
jgi:hypothetical protein